YLLHVLSKGHPVGNLCGLNMQDFRPHIPVHFGGSLDIENYCTLSCIPSSFFERRHVAQKLKLTHRYAT
ncbi:hypothetical protein, partial [Xenorhabdus japonica]